MMRVFQVLFYLVAEVSAGLAGAGAELGDDLADFDLELLVDLEEWCPAAHHEVPDGDGQFAGQGSDREFDGAFAGQQFFAPLGHGMGGPKEGLASFDQEAAQILATVAADAALPLALAAVVEGGI